MDEDKGQPGKERQQVIHHILAMKDDHFAASKQAGIPAAARLEKPILSQADQISCLEQIYRHLRPGGYCLIAIMVPDVAKLAQKPTETFAVRREFNLPNGYCR